MNKDIMIMIELQKYWDVVMSSRAEIDKATNGLKAGEKELSAMKAKLSTLGARIKEMKTSLKQRELELSDMSSRIKKLEERKRNIQTERELKALEKEIEVLKFDSSSLEEKTLILIDELDLKEKDYALMDAEVKQHEEKLNSFKPAFEKEISRHQEIIKSNESSFNALSADLSPTSKSKFLKIITSREGKAIARVEGEICGYCNRKIPASLAIDASRDDKIVNCSNCGKYIYR
jgi:predicted  nucleic acid-binding Zn-ribbon protein